MSLTSLNLQIMSRKNFPPEIIDAILVLLPAKSLGRFKCVSKTWNSLISDSRFVKKHVRHTRKQQTKLILVHYQDSLYSIDTDEFLPYLNTDNDIPSTPKELNFGSPPMWWQEEIFGLCNGLFGSPPMRWQEEIFGSCNGLFGSLPMRWQEEIFGSCNGLVLSRDIDFDMFVMNPVTRELCKLPVNPFDTPFLNAGVTGRVQYFIRFGFGYDSSTDDYKLVRIWFFGSPSNIHLVFTDNVSVYSFRNNSWKELPNGPHEHPAYGGALVNENYHWLASSSVIAFSFGDEVFTQIKLPDSFCNHTLLPYDDMVVEIGGRLGLCLHIQGGYELWVMHEYGDPKSWTRVYSHRSSVFPVCLVGGNCRDIVLNDKNEVVVFNIDEERCRNVTTIGDRTRFIAGTFVESIESPARIMAVP